MKDNLLGAIYGHLVGDALGVPYEFLSPEEIPEKIDWRGYGTHNQPAGTWSDDGALMLCLLASLVDRGAFDPEDIGKRFVAWFDSGYMAAGGVVFDYGGTTDTAINRLRQGVNPLEAGPNDEWSNGNGSLMRILPISLWASRLPIDEHIDLAHKCSRITHGHIRAQVCCAVYSVITRMLLGGDARNDVLDKAIEHTRAVYLNDSRWGKPFLKELKLVEDYKPRTGSGYVVDCLLTSMEALSQAKDFAEAVEVAVRYGNDTDTTAAVTGGLAGLVFGLEGIPRLSRAG